MSMLLNRRIIAAVGATTIVLIAISVMLIGDIDEDGLPGHWEVTNGLNPFRKDANSDYDHDRLDALAEFWIGTNAAASDTDGDGTSDFDELENGEGPLDSGMDMLAAPSDINVETTNEGYLITWKNNEANATRNILLRTDNGSTWMTIAVLPASESSCLDTQIQPKVAYFYTLIATDL